MNTETKQSQLLTPYEVWTNDHTDIACEECARKFAEEHQLEWHSWYSWTERAEELGKGVSEIASYALGDSDYPYSCCGFYLDTRFTAEGERTLKEEFPQWVQELYGYHTP